MQTTVTISLEVTVTVHARAERSDYGVEGSPVWYEPVDLNCDPLIEIEGVHISLDSLPKDVREMIEEQAIDAAHDGDW